MGRRGPLTKPASVTLLEGNPGKRPLREKATTGTGIVACPEWLTGEARAEWLRLAPDLIERGLLTSLDLGAFAAYCQALARWIDCQRVISKGGAVYLTAKGRLLERPETVMALKFGKEARELGAQFGLTPASRTRLDLGGADEPCCWRCGMPVELCGCR